MPLKYYKLLKLCHPFLSVLDGKFKSSVDITEALYNESLSVHRHVCIITFTCLITTSACWSSKDHTFVMRFMDDFLLFILTKAISTRGILKFFERTVLVTLRYRHYSVIWQEVSQYHRGESEPMPTWANVCKTVDCVQYCAVITLYNLGKTKTKKCEKIEKGRYCSRKFYAHNLRVLLAPSVSKTWWWCCPHSGFRIPAKYFSQSLSENVQIVSYLWKQEKISRL